MTPAGDLVLDAVDHARAVGGEVSYDPGHAPGARFTVSVPAG